jgi:uncharacterized protein YdeI (YjbR/CyaY-like superfamily)
MRILLLMNKSDQLPRFYPHNRQEWRDWLEENHQSSLGLWIIYYKKGTNKPTISYDEAVEDALSFGWIDSKVNAMDEHRYMQLFTPRKPGSTWSKINKKRIKKVIKLGLMKPAGMKKVEAAKEDGSWSILDDVEDLIIPKDLKKAFKKNRAAEINYSNFTSSTKKGILFWIASAKRPETRENRIKKTIEQVSNNKNPLG